MRLIRSIVWNLFNKNRMHSLEDIMSALGVGGRELILLPIDWQRMGMESYQYFQIVISRFGILNFHHNCVTGRTFLCYSAFLIWVRIFVILPYFCRVLFCQTNKQNVNLG